MRPTTKAIALPLFTGLATAAAPALAQDGGLDTGQTDFETAREAPLVVAPSTDPSRFVDCVDNPFLPYVPGTVWHLTETTKDGEQTVTITVLKETREIMGITATVVHDIVEQDGETIENTRDWYAQDDRGNVWYLGEDTAEYENGKIVSHEGSWEAGVNGAREGIVMLADPRPGDLYYEEYEEGDAEDMGAVESLSDSVEVPYGSYDSVLRTADFNPLDPSLETKWYVSGIGVVKAAAADGGSSEVLTDITHDADEEDPSRNCGADGGISRVGN